MNLDNILFDFFDLPEIQGIQDSFSAATSVASLITEVDGTPITNSSNTCYLCNQIIRKTEKGRKNCILSNSIIGSPKKNGSRIQKCLGAGLICAATSIIIDGKQVSNWLIGQVIDEDDEMEDLLAYADVIGVNRDVYKNELVKVKRMSKQKFENICNLLNMNAQQLSKFAMKNISLTKEIEKKIIKENEIIILNGELEKQKKFLKEMVNVIPDLIFYKDTSSVYLGSNKSFAEKFIGLSEDEIIGKTDLDFLKDEELARFFREKDKEILKDGVTKTNEETITLADGTVIEIETAKSPFFDENDKVAGLIGISRDITERKKEEEALQFKTAFLEAQVNSSLDGILVVKQNRRRILTNRRFFEIFNIPQHIIDDEDDTSLLKYTVSLAKEPEQFLKKVLYLYDHHKEASFDEIEFKSGMVLERYSSPVFNKEGKCYGRIWTFHDVTESKKVKTDLIQKVRSQDILLKTSRRFAKIVDQDINDETINLTLQELGEFNDADRCYVVLFSEDGSKINTTCEWCAEGIPPAISVLKNLPTDFFPWTLGQLKCFGTVYIPCINDLPLEDGPEKGFLQSKASKGLILIPINYTGNLMGFLGFGSTTKKTILAEENTIMMELMAQIFANALQRKKYIANIRESENYYRAIFENTGGGTMVIEKDLTIITVNEEFQTLLGYTRENLIGKKLTDFIPGDMCETIQEYNHKRQLNPAVEPFKYQTQVIDIQGKYRDGLVTVDIISGTNKSVVNFVDFTEFNRIDRSLKALNAITIAMAQEKNEEDLLRNVCQKIVEVTGYSLVWVGYLQADQQQTVQIVASAGTDDGYLDKINITLQDSKRGQGPVATAIRTCHPVSPGTSEKMTFLNPG